jgi:cation:H+ antiporter
MALLGALIIFALSVLVIWYFSGILIDAVERVAKRFRKTGFTVAFLVLGLLTSIGEFSVMTNALLQGMPEVSAGNLVGASLLLLLFVLPFLAVVGGGISVQKTLKHMHFFSALFVIALPVLFLSDGKVTILEGLTSMLGYGILLFIFQMERHKPVEEVFEEVEEELRKEDYHRGKKDVGLIVIGSVCIFLAGHGLVQQTVYFATLLSLPPAIISLLLLSVGTNIPEILFIFRSVKKHRVDIAFGDYLGSAVTNTFIFGILTLCTGGFRVDQNAFFLTLLLLTLGFMALFFCAWTRNHLSRREGAFLMCLYASFCLLQVVIG